MRTDDAFAALFAGRAAALRRTAYLLCGNWHRAEDLTQTAFAKLYAAWPRLRDEGAAEAYLRRTLLRTYLDDNRRAWRGEHPTETLPETPVVDPSADDRMVLLDALAQVAPRQRACLVLRYFDDLSVEDTAEVLGCSTGTVKSNTSRGLDTLRRLIGDDELELTALGGNR
ncbi:MAG TPA: SigE family RNA polymerase sigma factor [Mycobacteriales bacterium]|nr:SigE family RNA polymerase sigma factor [Mycobacteriales bacterium]